jgi:hypothetical protein
MRRVLLFLVLLASAAALRAADAEFIRVWPAWRDAASFERIGEYFGGTEQHGREIVLRTAPAERAGYYFLVRVKHAALSGAQFTVKVIRPDAPDVRTFTFPMPEARAGESVFQLGITGADWPGGAQASPVAWNLELTDSSGRLLATQKSFLWEKPAK